jgi:ribosomal subunit interface protein
MQIKVSGQHMELGDSFKTHIEESLKKNVKKFFEHAVNANVAMSKDRHHLFSTEIVVNEGTGNGVVIKGNSQDADPYRSFDSAVEKIEKQLRRYKSRIKAHHGDKQARQAFFASKQYVMSPFSNEDDQAHKVDAPAIIAELDHSIETLSVGDAVMKMDLLDVPALMFINAANSRVNMVYYRNDGNIAWVDSHEK